MNARDLLVIPAYGLELFRSAAPLEQLQLVFTHLVFSKSSWETFPVTGLRVHKIREE